jgi:integrase/recombinase XerD|tara:strand:+ start:226 stop:801 length:576 start_codon:yes stop_codon:yes gene_type:complete
MKKDRKGRAKVLTSDQVDQVIKFLPSALHKTIALTLRISGARISEVIQLRWEDLDKEELQFPREITKKQLDTREIPIEEDYYNQMMIWKSEWAALKGRQPSKKDYIFPGRFNGSHITSRSFMYAHEEALERAEISKATTHSYRRTQLTQLHKKGVPLKVVQSLSGHRSLDTLSRYLEVSDQDKREAVKHLV